MLMSFPCLLILRAFYRLDSSTGNLNKQEMKYRPGCVICDPADSGLFLLLHENVCCTFLCAEHEIQICSYVKGAERSTFQGQCD